MTFNYICIYHIERMQVCETEAFRNWGQMMHRGVKAWADCRAEAAHIYLNSALDIALLRSCCENNGIFEEMHFIKPAEFLIELYLLDNAFDHALTLLARVSSLEEVSSQGLSEHASNFLLRQYERVELAEKAFFGRRRQVEVSANNRVSYPIH